MRQPTLILTRPRASAERFAASLTGSTLASVRLLIAPLMRIEPMRDAPDVPHDARVIFTSAQGVLNAPSGEGRAAYCVGVKTAEAARSAGWRACAAGETAEELIATVLGEGIAGPLVHLSGDHQRGDIAERLTAAGVPTQRLVLYRQILLPLAPEAREALGGPAIVPLFSPRTALQFAREAPRDLPQAHLIALSDSVAQNLAGLDPAELVVSPAPTAAFMRNTVENLCARITSA